ncbi:MAG: FAD-dependent oxidoreductase [Roseburia sp.]|jgi:pyruvate/2-oxoglutarate dehydrogenase complex dihydrolipoamide dehydrogenase (E3) component|nr:FAD-dependent oxidoreductase [Roseburia sp.]
MHNYLNHLVWQATHNDNIEVRLNCEATPKLAASLEPDELVVAVGSEPVKLRIPGADRKNVWDILEAHEHIKEDWGDTVIIGGGPSGIELALTLAEKSTKTTVVEMSGEIAENGNSLYHAAAEIRLQECADLIQIRKETTCDEITDTGVRVTGKNGNSSEIPAQHVVSCVGMRAKKELAESFYGLVYDVKMIGDCVKARRINEASHEGYFAGFGM